MLKREAVADILRDYADDVLSNGERKDITDAILALLPTDEALGRAAQSAVVDAIGDCSTHCGRLVMRIDHPNAEIGRAILKELSRETHSNPMGNGEGSQGKERG